MSDLFACAYLSVCSSMCARLCVASSRSPHAPSSGSPRGPVALKITGIFYAAIYLSRLFSLPAFFYVSCTRPQITFHSTVRLGRVYRPHCTSSRPTYDTARISMRSRVRAPGLQQAVAEGPAAADAARALVLGLPRRNVCGVGSQHGGHPALRGRHPGPLHRRDGPIVGGLLLRARVKAHAARAALSS